MARQSQAQKAAIAAAKAAEVAKAKEIAAASAAEEAKQQTTAEDGSGDTTQDTTEATEANPDDAATDIADAGPETIQDDADTNEDAALGDTASQEEPPPGEPLDPPEGDENTNEGKPASDMQDTDDESEAESDKAESTESAIEYPEGVSANIVNVMNNHIANMAMNVPVAQSDGVKQDKLLQAGIINAMTVAEETIALNNIRYILEFINNDTSSGCWSERAIFRFYDVITWNNKVDRREIETLLTLFINTRNPETRAVEAKKLDWDSMGRVMEPRRVEMMIRRLRTVYGMN